MRDRAPFLRLTSYLGIALACWAAASPSEAQSVTPAGPHAPASRVALAANLLGTVTVQASGAPVANARVTVFTPGLGFFREVRTQTAGTYMFPLLPSGPFQVGVAAPGFDYIETTAVLSSGSNQLDFALLPETHQGAWSVIGDTSPEVFDATDIAALRPDGKILYCHDTVDPVLFDPVSGLKSFPSGSTSEQGCMNTTQLTDGSVLFVGGQDGSSPGSFTNAIPWVKRFLPANFFTQQGDMLLSVGRWYPGLARLADGRLLIMGGGTAPSAQRTDTCELYDDTTQSWTWTDTMNSPLEFPPSALLYTGKVLRTWGIAPELFDAQSQQWQPTGGFVYANRGFPGHSDHSLVVLSDGRALAVGVRRTGQPAAVMTEFYAPGNGTWSIGSSPSLVRMQCEVVYLPDGRVFVGAGDQETTAGPEPNVLGIVRRCDLFDPSSTTWRRVTDMLAFREYHGVTLLVPDGRVVTTGGTRIKFQVGPTSNAIEGWSPPYLFRGVRPEISALSDTTPVRGQTVAFSVFPQTKLTHVVLMGLQSTTHWVDGGIPRRLVLPVAQAGSNASVSVPTDPNLVPLGWYMLFGMVDDIPSVARILRVDP
jgi:hypothetical protein